MRKTLTAFAIAAATLLSSGSAWAENVTLKYSNWLPPTHFLNQTFQAWFKEIETATEGRVKVDILPKQVGATAAQYDVIRDGLADMALVNLGFTPGRFVAAEVGELPLLGNKGAVLGPVFWRHYEKYIKPADELAGVQTVSIWMITPLNIITVGKTIAKVEDLNGLKIRTTNQNTVKAMELLGAVPILKAITEVFELLTAKTIDGMITNLNTLTSFSLTDLLDHATIVPGGVSNQVNAMLVNPAAWAKISDADKAAIMKLGGVNLATIVGTQYDVEDGKSLEIMKSKGYKVTVGDDTMRAALAEKWKSVEEAWLARAKEKGIKDPEGQLADLRAEIAKLEK